MFGALRKLPALQGHSLLRVVRTTAVHVVARKDRCTLCRCFKCMCAKCSLDDYKCRVPWSKDPVNFCVVIAAPHLGLGEGPSLSVKEPGSS